MATIVLPSRIGPERDLTPEQKRRVQEILNGPGTDKEKSKKILDYILSSSHTGEHLPVVGPVLGAASDIGDATQTVGHLVGALFDPHFWLRVGEGVVGLVLIIIGVNKLFSFNIGGRVMSYA